MIYVILTMGIIILIITLLVGYKFALKVKDMFHRSIILSTDVLPMVSTLLALITFLTISILMIITSIMGINNGLIN